MDVNLKSGVGSTKVASHGGENAVHSVDGENVDESFREVKKDESNAGEETIDVEQPFGEQLWNLEELLNLSQQCLDHCTVKTSSEDLQETKTLLVNYMDLICEHRNQLDSRLDLQTAIGEVASRFLYVLFHLGDYEECIHWFETGIRTEDALRELLEVSGSVQYNVAISFLRTAHAKTDVQRLSYLIGRGMRHLERSCLLQVEDFDSLKLKMRNEVKYDVETGMVTVTLGRLLLVPGEMFEKLLGRPYSHFTNQQVIHLLDEVLASAIGMKDNVEREAILKMGVTFASKIENEEMRDGFLESFQIELRKIYNTTHQKAPKIDEAKLKDALQPISFVETTGKNSKSGDVWAEVASTSGYADVQQPFGEEVKLDEILTLSKECLERTVEGSSEDLQEAKTLLVNYMSLIFEHRNQLDSRLDFRTAISDVTSRFMYVLFHLKDYEECIHWFEMGIRREDALRESLEVSGSVQYNVAISFLKRCVGNADLQRLQVGDVNHDFWRRGMEHLEKSCQLQVENFDTLAFKQKNEAGIRVGTGIYVTMGNLLLVPASDMLEKLLGTPYSYFTHQQVEDLLGKVQASTTEMIDKDWLVEAEAVLKMGVTFASKIEDEELKDRFLDGVLTQLRHLHQFRGEYQKAAETYELSKFSQKLSTFRERQLRESKRAEAWSLAGHHNRAIDIITTACSAVDVEDWKLKAHLKFTYGRILERAGWADEAIKQMEEAKSLCLIFNYNGDDEGVNVGLGRLLQLYGQIEKYVESALSLFEMIKSIILKPECTDDFKKRGMLEGGLISFAVRDQDEAEECWEHDDGTDEAEDGTDDLEDGTDELEGGTDELEDGSKFEPDHDGVSNFQRGVIERGKELYKEHQYERCSRCKGKHLRDPKSHWQTFFYLAKLKWKHFEIALAASKAAELVVHRRLGGERCRLVDVYMLRGSIYSSNQEPEVAYKVYEQAVTILQKMNQGDDEIRKRLSFCYGMQARQRLEREDDVDGSVDLMKRAAPELEKNNPGMYCYLQAMAHGLQGKMQEAATWGEKAARELIIEQQSRPFRTRLAQMPWIRAFEESTLRVVFKYNELVSLKGLGNHRNALIWTERSRSRLYMRMADKDQPSVDCSTSTEQFDFCYKHAEELLGDTLLMCGADTAIISYSYWKGSNCLVCYLTFTDGDNIRIHAKEVDVTEHLAQWEKSDGPKTLELLVEEALDTIRKTVKKSKKDPKERAATKKAKNLLSILHSVFIKSIQDQLPERCKNLVISQPHGFMSQFPFQALYDETRGEFLIQQKTVCVIPSIRTLHRCFQSQARFEEQWEHLNPPFVAGDPDPMGAETPESDVPMDRLGGAAREAAKVAEILGDAQLFSGAKMTKANVVQGLSESRVVLLSTHGVLNTYYPEGALILRGKVGASASSSSGERAEDAALTPADTDAISIPAGLVVLSACHSGLGKATQSEGVLGLGRAIMQAGAATTILSLWGVLDEVTANLSTGMFEKLQQEGWTVPESLQAVMKDMILKQKTLYEWAPLIAMGSPKLRLRKGSFEFKFISTITPDSRCKVMWKQQLLEYGVCQCDD